MNKTDYKMFENSLGISKLPFKSYNTTRFEHLKGYSVMFLTLVTRIEKVMLIL